MVSSSKLRFAQLMAVGLALAQVGCGATQTQVGEGPRSAAVAPSPPAPGRPDAEPSRGTPRARFTVSIPGVHEAAHTAGRPSDAGPRPWTHLQADADDHAFRFAIVTDRTGGARAGVFQSAIPKLNMLRPELVMSVGDLIQGYTDDRSQIEREWDEFDGFVAGLHAPFFYVGGNHDLTNAMMREVWKQRYGPTHYAFEYRDVLFVCLDSMDGAHHHISKAQVAWLREVLATHLHVRWTLLFMHSPLWDRVKHPPEATGSQPEQGWAAVKAALGERPYTAFAGHHHRYLRHVIDDRKHFTLATTGGMSKLRGPGYGEFDHVVWVTMDEHGPTIANLVLEGIVEEGVRTALPDGSAPPYPDAEPARDGRPTRSGATTP